MWNLHHLRRGNRRHVAALATAAASLALMATENEEKIEAENDGTTTRSPSSTSSTSASWTPSTALHATTQCESAFRLPPLMSRLRRNTTVQKLRESSLGNVANLESRYKVDWSEPIGEGGFGSVFEAIDRKTNERVAVKRIDKRFTCHRSFQREIDALMVLQQAGGHPNICGLRATFDAPDHFYIVLDLVAGPEMFEQLCCHGPYSEADAAWHVRQIASALCWMHSLGLVHSDLKPENVLLSRDDPDAVVKLVDFGCAHNSSSTNGLTQQQAQDTALHGRSRSNHTPAYSPPEILMHMKDKSKPDDPNIEPSFDAWSLGVILYTMLVGSHPFDPECNCTDLALEKRIIDHNGSLANKDLTQHLSPDALQLIQGLMHPNPKKRLTTAQLLQNPWVMGKTASSTKIQGSDQRLAVYKRYKTQIGSAFFKALLEETDSIHQSNTSERVSLLESAFRRLDTQNTGYLLPDAATSLDGKVGFSYADISSLLGGDNLKSRYFPKGHVLYNVGDKGDCLYLIDSGTVQFTTKDGFHKTLGTGELVGEELMKDANAQYSGSARCETPVHALAISRELFEKYVHSDEETLLSMVERYRYRRRERASMVLRNQKSSNTSTTYPQHRAIFRAGDPGTHLYLVEEGEVDISVRNSTVRHLKANEWTGEHAVLFGKPYNVTARCVSEGGCRVQAMDSRVLQRLFEADPSLKQDFRELVLRRDFKKALCAKIGRAFPRTEQEIKSAFDSIDVQGRGEIELDGLRSMVQRFDSTYGEKDIQDMFQSLDLNGSGKLSWKEFHRIFAMDMES